MDGGEAGSSDPDAPDREAQWRRPGAGTPESSRRRMPSVDEAPDDTLYWVPPEFRRETAAQPAEHPSTSIERAAGLSPSIERAAGDDLAIDVGRIDNVDHPAPAGITWFGRHPFNVVAAVVLLGAVTLGVVMSFRSESVSSGDLSVLRLPDRVDEQWSIEIDERFVWGAVAAGDIVATAAGPDAMVVALDRASGARRWTVGVGAANSVIEMSALHHDRGDVIAVRAERSDGGAVLRGLDASTGEELWLEDDGGRPLRVLRGRLYRTEMSAESFGLVRLDARDASPLARVDGVVGGGRDLVVASTGGKIALVDLDTLTPVASSLDLDVDEGVVAAGDDRVVTAIDGEIEVTDLAGRPIGSAALPASVARPVYEMLVIDRHRVVVSHRGGSIGIDISDTPTLVWSSELHFVDFPVDGDEAVLIKMSDDQDRQVLVDAATGAEVVAVRRGDVLVVTADGAFATGPDEAGDGSDSILGRELDGSDRWLLPLPAGATGYPVDDGVLVVRRAASGPSVLTLFG